MLNPGPVDPLYKLNIIEFYLSELGVEGQLLIEKVQSVEDGLRKLYNAYEIQPNVMQDSTKGPSSNVGGEKLYDDVEDDLAGFETFQSQYKKLKIVLICIYEDEVDEKELIDEDIEKLVKSSSKLLGLLNFPNKRLVWDKFSAFSSVTCDAS
ncbi:hypothetical protein Tco_1141448 [Tanacetum coccineum]